MSVVITRPASQIAASGSPDNVGGAANRAAAQADDTDTTYIQYDSVNDALELLMAQPTIPGGSAILAVELRVRCRKIGAGNPKAIFAISSGVDFSGFVTQIVTWTTPTTITALTIFPGDDTDKIGTGDLPWDFANIDFSCTVLNNNTMRVSESFLYTYYVAPSVVTVTLPTGTLTSDNQPTVTWTETHDADGNAIDKYQVKIFSAAQYGAGGFDPDTSTATYDSGVVDNFVFGGASHPTDVALADGTYRSYVKQHQTVSGQDLWSAWDYEQFVVDVDRPGVPTLAVSEENDRARAKIDVTVVSGPATTSWLEIEVSHDGGATWGIVRTLDSGKIVETSGTHTVYYYEQDAGEEVQFRARSAHDYSGVTAYSSYSGQEASTITPYTWWLKNPLKPSSNLPVKIRSQSGHTRPVKQGVFSPLGRKIPIVVDDVRGGPQGEIAFRIDSEDDRRNFYAMLDNTNGPYWLTAPRYQDWQGRYVKFGDLGSERVIDSNVGHKTFESLTWIEVDSPSDDIDAWTDPPTTAAPDWAY